MDYQIKKENNVKHEYRRSVKILNNLSSTTFEEIKKICNEVEEMLGEFEIEELIMEKFEQTFKDLQALKKVSIKYMKVEPIVKEQIIELVASMVNLICNILNEINITNKLIASLNISSKTKAITSFHLKYLKNILKEVII